MGTQNLIIEAVQAAIEVPYEWVGCHPYEAVALHNAGYTVGIWVLCRGGDFVTPDLKDRKPLDLIKGGKLGLVTTEISEFIDLPDIKKARGLIKVLVPHPGAITKQAILDDLFEGTGGTMTVTLQEKDHGRAYIGSILFVDERGVPHLLRGPQDAADLYRDIANAGIFGKVAARQGARAIIEHVSARRVHRWLLGEADRPLFPSGKRVGIMQGSDPHPLEQGDGAYYYTTRVDKASGLGIVVSEASRILSRVPTNCTVIEVFDDGTVMVQMHEVAPDSYGTPEYMGGIEIEQASEVS